MGAANTELCVGVPEEEEHEETTSFVTIEMSSYHMENAITKRAFHSNVYIYLQKNEVAALHAYLGYLLNA